MAKNASKKLADAVALMVRFGTGSTPAPIMAIIPHSVMKAALTRPSQLSRPKVRGSEIRNVTTEKISSRKVAQSPLFESSERAS